MTGFSHKLVRFFLLGFIATLLVTSGVVNGKHIEKRQLGGMMGPGMMGGGMMGAGMMGGGLMGGGMLGGGGGILDLVLLSSLMGGNGGFGGGNNGRERHHGRGKREEMQEMPEY